MAYSGRFLEHTADFKIEVSADSLKDLFQGALKLVAELLQPDKTQLKEPIDLKISVKASSPTELLVDFLNEVVTFSDIHNSIFPKIIFSSFTENSLEGILKGKKVKSFRREIKGVTYHQLKITKQDQKWKVILVIDV